MIVYVGFHNVDWLCLPPAFDLLCVLFDLAVMVSAAENLPLPLKHHSP